MSLVSFLANGDWTLDFHDQTVLDWIITLGYCVAAGGCFWAWRLERQRRLPMHRFWLVMAILMAFLGVNKQLNFQTLLGDVGRDAALDEGWYQHRRTLQKTFVVCFGLGGLVALGFLSWWIRKEWKRYGLALGGLAMAGLYAAVRAATFHHVLQDPGGPRHHPYSQEVIEVLAVAMVCAAVVLVIRSDRKPKLQAFERVVRIR